MSPGQGQYCDVNLRFFSLWTWLETMGWDGIMKRVSVDGEKPDSTDCTLDIPTQRDQEDEAESGETAEQPVVESQEIVVLGAKQGENGRLCPEVPKGQMW